MMVLMLMIQKVIDLNNFDSHEEGEGEGGDDHQDRGDRQQVREDARTLLASWVLIMVTTQLNLFPFLLVDLLILGP